MTGSLCWFCHKFEDRLVTHFASLPRKMIDILLLQAFFFFLYSLCRITISIR